MTNPLLDDIIGPSITQSIVTELLEQRVRYVGTSILVDAKIDTSFQSHIDGLNGNAVAAWYNFYGNEDDCIHLPDQRVFVVVDTMYQGNGLFGIQLRQRKK